MNIGADYLAQREQSKKGRDPVLHIPLAGPLLRIVLVVVTARLRDTLTQEAEKDEMGSYIQKKFESSKITVSKIAWDDHGEALRKLNPMQHKTIIWQIYGWLPTGKRLHRQDQSEDHRCPLCKQVNEDNLHMFHCRHKIIQEKQRAMLNNL